MFSIISQSAPAPFVSRDAETKHVIMIAGIHSFLD